MVFLVAILSSHDGLAVVGCVVKEPMPATAKATPPLLMDILLISGLTGSSARRDSPWMVGLIDVIFFRCLTTVSLSSLFQIL